jgi:hypothetical protein
VASHGALTRRSAADDRMPDRCGPAVRAQGTSGGGAAEVAARPEARRDTGKGNGGFAGVDGQPTMAAARVSWRVAASTHPTHRHSLVLSWVRSADHRASIEFLARTGGDTTGGALRVSWEADEFLDSAGSSLDADFASGRVIPARRLTARCTARLPTKP